MSGNKIIVCSKIKRDLSAIAIISGTDQNDLLTKCSKCHFGFLCPDIHCSVKDEKIYLESRFWIIDEPETPKKLV